MTEDNIDYKIGVMQAFKEGKTIQYQLKDGQHWFTSPDPEWNWGKYIYRVKPEPKEDWVFEIKNSKNEWQFYGNCYQRTYSEVTSLGWGQENTATRLRRIEPAKE